MTLITMCPFIHLLHLSYGWFAMLMLTPVIWREVHVYNVSVLSCSETAHPAKLGTLHTV